MILSKEVEIVFNPSNFNHFKSLGYENLKSGNKLIIPINHLNDGSNCIIKVKCDICGLEKELVYRYYNKNDIYACSSKCSVLKKKETNLKKFGVEYYSQTNESKEKIKQTCLEKYGVDNVSKNEVNKTKRKNTMLKKYNVELYVLSKDFINKYIQTSMINYGTNHPMSSDKMKQIKNEYFIKKGFNVLSKEYEIYKRKVYRLTGKVKYNLIDSWDGNDYYDNEYIKSNFNLPYYDKNYPTIDHKISIFEGYKNNISAEIISDLTNLCFTKRYINSKKYTKTNFIN